MGPAFQLLAFTPAAEPHPSLAIAASRAGLIGVFNAEFGLPADDLAAALGRLEGAARGAWGLKLRQLAGAAGEVALRFIAEGRLRWLIVDAEAAAGAAERLAAARAGGCQLLLELTAWPAAETALPAHDGLIVKGHEAGGRIGEETTFILLQKALAGQGRPVFARGGLGANAIAAVRAVGAVGVVLDDQVLLLAESPVRQRAERYLAGFSGLETGIIADGWRFLEKPGFAHTRALRQEAATLSAEQLAARIEAAVGWDDPARQLVPIGQGAVFAGEFAARHGNLARLARALEAQSEGQVRLANTHTPLAEGHGVARSHGTAFPIVQGPMTRVSDTAAFAEAVAAAGGLPMLALALMAPEAVEQLLTEVKVRLGERPWGVGLLGFAPSDLLAGQVEVVRRFNPRFALIAGGRPGQARALDADGIASYLHVPSPALLRLFLEQGAERFVFEGRECGGHIGPLASFVLWDLMVETLLAALKEEARPERFNVLFAGGIHDELSAAMVAVLAAPLAARGVNIGVLMGTAYLFTREIVDSGAIVPSFQEAALGCARTVSLETGPGHASRCALTPFAEQFLEEKRRLSEAGKSPEEISLALEELTLGRLRLASKGVDRRGAGGEIVPVSVAEQRERGMYMIGQAATAIRELTTVAELHRAVSAGAGALIAGRADVTVAATTAKPPLRPADIAVVGLAAVFPKAGDVTRYWENILDGVDAVTEIPAHRWDWRLYFDEDRRAPDKIYSRWGGFLDDIAFDPTRYGIPPVAIKAVDPLQLMTLVVVDACLEDAGYGERAFDRERVSIILGASGGAGDVGAQYAVRAEMPRFLGELDGEAAGRLPAWTEDTFAGILLNVAAGRAANRFDFGGINLTVDAACASSLAAVYQGMLELESGRSDMVICGGVDTVQGPFGYLCFSKTQALSPQGRCKTFDAGADGIVISEGIALLALKRLADAERAGDRIYAVIKGVGGSSDGRAKSMTAPHPDGQIRALSRAYAMAGYSPASVGLFEAHGTGTVAGDTAELSALTRLLTSHGATPRQSAIGSVKTLIGHTKATAGAAGLIKAVLACYHRVLPPHGPIGTPNPQLTDPASPLFLVGQPLPWLHPTDGTPRRASVSAFGFGGTNFHATLEEYDDHFLPAPRPAVRDRWSHELLVWRAPERAQLAAAVRAVAAQLAAGAAPELHDLAFTLASSLPAHGLTAALVLERDGPLAERLAALAAHLDGNGAPPPAGAFVSAAPLIAGGGKVALVFSGQGTQYPGMFLAAMTLFPEMCAALERADQVLAERLQAKGAPGGRLSRVIYPVDAYNGRLRAAAAAQLTQTDYAQPALGVVEAGLWAIFARLGLKAAMAAGHSYGEYVALYAAGVLSFDDLVSVSETRGRCMVEAAKGNLGTMAALQCDRGAAEALLAGRPELCLAAHNAPTQTIVAGTVPAIEALLAELADGPITANRLPVGAAFHSPLIAPASARFATFLADLDLRAPAFPVFANVTARPHGEDAAAMRALLVRQLVSPVEFVAEIEAMYEAGARVFLGIGPKRVQANLVAQILGERPHRAIAVDDEEGGLKGLLEAVAALLAEGAPLAVGELFAGRDCRKLALDDLASSPRRQPLGAHHWLLNGSGARRVGEAPLQPLTLEAVAARRQPEATTVTLQPAAQPVAVTGRDRDDVRAVCRSATAPHWRQGIGGTMTQGNGGAPPGEQLIEHEGLSDYPLIGERHAVLAEYQETMRRFLETQEAVMTAFLTGRAGSWPVRERPLAPRVLRMAARPAVSPPVSPPASARVEAPARVRPQAEAKAPTPCREDGPAAKGNGASASALGHGAAGHGAAGNGVDRAAIGEQLLTLVEERTGYPRDMLGMDRDMEAELGIDSIKRVEIVGALLKAMPAEVRAAAAEVGETLNRQKTLNGIVDTLWQVVAKGTPVEAGSAPRPFELAGAGPAPAVAAAPLPRYTIEAQAEPLPAGAPPLPGGLYLITDDGGGIATTLAARIEGGDRRTLILAPGDEEALARLGNGARVAAFLHLAPISATPLPLSAPAAAWQAELARNEEAAFRFLRRYAADLASGGRVLLASGLGGRFARGGTAPSALMLQGGGPGLAKSLREEWPDCIAKAVDLDPGAPADENAAHLLAELAEPAGRSEVGYPGGVRTIFRTVPAALAADAPARPWLDSGSVVLATGGARGITATLLGGIATAGMTLVLIGRTPPPQPEDERWREAATPEDLRRLLLAEAKGTAATPAEIEHRLRALLRDREIRANLDRLAAGGAVVDYRCCDVRDFEAVAALLDDVYARYGRLDGVVHGAGIIEDRLLRDKSEASWQRVVATKVEGAIALARHVRADTLSFFVLFTSVAGRYGNSGQTDYAAANELLNRLAWQLHHHWGRRVKVCAVNWGPWLPEGAGMVSAETQRKFEAKGVRLVDAAGGIAFFRDEILRAPLDQVEVIAGEGPWERHEAALGALPTRPGGAVAAPLPLMAGARRDGAATRGALWRRRLTVGDDRFLDQHRLDGVPVLPAAFALELMAEAAATLWPDWQVVEVSDFRLLKGVSLDSDAPVEVAIRLQGSEHGDAAGFTAAAELVAGADPALRHYRATLRLADSLPPGEPFPLPPAPAPAPLSAHDAYRELLFHGPALQTITRLVGLDGAAILAEVAPRSPAEALAAAAGAGPWLFDPGLLDAGPQLALVWSKLQRDCAALPNRFARVRRFGGVGVPARLHLAVAASEADEVRADVAIIDADNRLCLFIDGMECAASARLNRLCGWRGEIRV